MGAVSLLLLSAAAVFGLVPFGDRNFVFMDACIQYIDLFAWLQHVLLGEDSVLWSFCRGIGGNAWPIFTYYLSSPLNLLVLLFERTELYAFYHLVAALKLVLAAGTMAVYLSMRFRHAIPAYAVVLFSAAYAMSEYGVHQVINVMWLDGFYLLPLVLLGVWRAGTRQGSACLVISSACAMIFNWYSGCIDLLFAGFFALWEGWIAHEGERFAWSAYALFLGRVIAGMLLGVGISAITFVPTLAGLAGGRGSVDWAAFSLHYNGKWSAFLTGQFWGAYSDKGRVSLFVGAFALFSALACFFNSSIPKRWRRRALVLPAFVALVFYWQPFYFLFSLLKVADSYWYRYSSIAIFLLIYLAGWNASRSRRLKALCERKHRLALVCLCIASLADLWGNFGTCIWNLYPHDGAAAYASYVRAQEAQLAALRSRAGETPYRVNQTVTFNMKPLHLRANYNEGMASRTMMLSSYTSASSNAQMRFFDRFGYRQGGENMNIVNTSFLGTDALLGTRYILTERTFQGLVRQDGLPLAAGKAVYENPFAWPLAFACSSIDFDGLTEEDPFLHTNAAYAQLFGRPMEVYHLVSSEGGQRDGQPYWSVPATPEGQIYGSIRADHDDGTAVLVIDGGEPQEYLRWNAPSVFDIPENGRAQHDIALRSEHPLSGLRPQFYRLDEAAMREAADLAWSRAADVSLGKGTAMIRITGRAGEKLFTSLPWDKGWKAEQNGRDVQPEAIVDALMGFTLDEGENEIHLHYELPGWKRGAAVTAGALVLFCLLLRRERRRSENVE